MSLKILICSHTFWPNVGGTEAVGEMLAEQFLRLGHSVEVATRTPGEGAEPFAYPVLRRPKAGELLAALERCDLCFHNNIGLQAAWGLAFRPRPWVVAHHTWIRRAEGNLGWQDRLKRQVLGAAAAHIAVSQAVADHLPVPATVIPNPYRDDLFTLIPDLPRDRELVFLGRLVSDKGADLLLDALALLGQAGLTPQLTVIGDGPERPALEAQATRLGLAARVSFVGICRGEALVRQLNAHRILVVPSRWQEPFGLVALEGIACGLAVVGSAAGGLAEAIGPCGLTFASGDVAALAGCLAQLLRSPVQLAARRAGAAAHLERHRPEAVARAYLRVFERVLARRPVQVPR